MPRKSSTKTAKSATRLPKRGQSAKKVAVKKGGGKSGAKKAAAGKAAAGKAAARKPAAKARAALAEYRRKRDFTRTREPAGGRSSTGKKLAFVIQKHAASHLHFDLRLELDGVMKSWAVPKGPSLDPTVKRLAMQVEDHPIEYNKFEGTIPEGEYGGGTVMLWDRGTYTAPGDEPDAEDALRRGYEKGDFKFELHGKRLQGSWVLVRIRRDEERRQWLLIKHRDEYAEEGADIVADVTTSVSTGRTMEEIGAASK